LKEEQEEKFKNTFIVMAKPGSETSIVDPDPYDPYVFGIRQFFVRDPDPSINRGKVRKTLIFYDFFFDFLSMKINVNVP
jgi:hypothetical protein